jgi:hypothetical protein
VGASSNISQSTMSTWRQGVTSCLGLSQSVFYWLYYLCLRQSLPMSLKPTHLPNWIFYARLHGISLVNLPQQNARLQFVQSSTACCSMCRTDNSALGQAPARPAPDIFQIRTSTDVFGIHRDTDVPGPGHHRISTETLIERCNFACYLALLPRKSLPKVPSSIITRCPSTHNVHSRLQLP